MAKEQNLQPPALNQAPIQPAAPVPAQVASVSSSISMQKILMIGVPMFIVQVIVVYFLMAKFISKPAASAETASASATEKVESADPNLLVIKDIIINPAGTNGGRFLLATIGIDVNSPEALVELNKKEVQVRDALNTVLTEKTLPQLIDITQREQLRTEIAKKMGDIINTGKVRNIYFSKFIIQ
jgi:flagellar FliL protein